MGEGALGVARVEGEVVGLVSLAELPGGNHLAGLLDVVDGGGELAPGVGGGEGGPVSGGQLVGDRVLVVALDAVVVRFVEFAVQPTDFLVFALDLDLHALHHLLQHFHFGGLVQRVLLDLPQRLPLERLQLLLCRSQLARGQVLLLDHCC